MKTYTLKLTSGTTYKLYDGTTLVTDTDLATLFGSAGSAYFVFDFDGGTPTATTDLTITDSSDAAVITNTGLTGIAEGKNFKGEWSDSATAFDTFVALTGKTLDEAELSFLMGKIKSAGGAIDYEISDNKSIAVIVTELFGVEKGGYAVLRIRNTATSSKYLYAGSDFSDRRFTLPPNGDCVMALFARDKVDNNYTNVYGGFLFPQGTNATNMYMFGGNRTGTGYMTIILGRSSIVDDLTTNSSTLVLSAKQGKVLNDKIGGDLSTLNTTVKTSLIAAINELVGLETLTGSAAPTTATEGKVGQLYLDTTNSDTYICTAIVPGTDPDPDTYTWEVIGGGGSGIPTTATFWGQSYDAVNNKVGGDISIGSFKIGVSSGNFYISNGAYSGRSFGMDSIGTPYFNKDLSMNGSNRITDLRDPVGNTDAVTKKYVDNRVLTNAGAPTTSTVGTVGQLLTDTTNGKLYICTDATNPYVWTEVGAGAGPVFTLQTTDPGEGAPLAANNFIGVYN